VGSEGFSGRQHSLPVLPPQAGRLADQSEQLSLGQIRSRPEGLLFRSEQPAARAVHRHAGRHIHCVHVGALLPVHLDGEERGVNGPGYSFVLKGFMGHDVAPVAGGVADTEKDRAVGALRLLENLLAPGIPVHRVFRVLEEIRGVLLAEAVTPSLGHKITSAVVCQ